MSARKDDTDISYLISHSGTRHIVGAWKKVSSILHSGSRITTLCEFGIRPEEALEVAACDCEFCLRELEIYRKTQR
jgi:hypothetical protein